VSAPAAALRHHLWRLVLRLCGGLEVRGALPSGGCVVVANHGSHADAPSILAALDPAHQPTVAAAADYWFDRPVKRWLCRTLVAGFPVCRTGGGYADLAAQQRALAAGRAVVIFPAGSRRTPHDRFHQGAFRLAQHSNVPVVPVRITGTAELLPPGGRRPHRAAIRVNIDEPITVDDPAGAAQLVQTRLTRHQPIAELSASSTCLAGNGSRSVTR
jgi:1-acyl-sn-glycerol-3-phosphate acyltransferase